VSSRDDILAQVRKNQPPPQPLPALPVFAAAPGSGVEPFKAALIRMGGRIAEAPARGELDALIRKLYPGAKVVCRIGTCDPRLSVSACPSCPRSCGFASVLLRESFSRKLTTALGTPR